MPLGAARGIAATAFRGVVHLALRPAEEGRGGAAAMVVDGLHMPGLALGTLATVEGPRLASSDA